MVSNLAKLLTKGNYLYIRGTFADSDGVRKERKIPLRLTSEISNLVSAEARILTLVEYVNKNGFIPDQLMWDTPKVEVKGTTKGITVSEASLTVIPLVVPFTSTFGVSHIS